MYFYICVPSLIFVCVINQNSLPFYLLKFHICTIFLHCELPVRNDYLSFLHFELLPVCHLITVFHFVSLKSYWLLGRILLLMSVIASMHYSYLFCLKRTQDFSCIRQTAESFCWDILFPSVCRIFQGNVKVAPKEPNRWCNFVYEASRQQLGHDSCRR